MTNAHFVESTVAKYRRLKIEQVVGFEQSLAIALAHHSTAIEGSSLTMTEVEQLIEKGITPGGKPLDHSHMVKDHYEAYFYMMEQIKAKSPISHELLHNLNGCVMKHTGGFVNTARGSFDMTKGDYRLYGVRAGETVFMDSSKVPAAMDKFISALNSKISSLPKMSITEQLKVSFSAHYDLVSIHPFADGNGRTSRLIMNYVQGLCGLPLILIDSKDRTNYINSIKKTREEENISFFHDYLLGQYEKQLQGEIKKHLKANKGLGFIHTL